MLLKGTRSHTSSTAQTASFQLVFHGTEGASLPFFQYTQITSFQLVFYVTEEASLLYFQ
jgi:hypothetical protein